jgi:glycosyltransferase involved in cell wall biosynthesis
VHIAHYLGAIACVLARGGTRPVPVVVKVSGSWELEHGVLAAGRGPVAALAQRCLKRAGTLQAISRRIAGELAAHGFDRERIVILPNAVDTARFRKVRRAAVPGRPLTAVFVGRLVREKGLDLLLNAWAQAFADRHDVRLDLVGHGELETGLRGQAEQLGIAGQVRFLGHRAQVEDVLAEADFGILPSLIEGLSNTLLEFMASGLPVLASRVSGSEDFIVSGRNGWLVEAGDVAALAGALRDAARLDPTALHRLGDQARADVEATAGLDSVVGRLLSLYRGAAPDIPAGADVPFAAPRESGG